MDIGRYVRTLWPWRWWNCLRTLRGGARIHPTACFQSNAERIVLGRGTKIGARCRLDAGATGRIISGARVWVSSDVEFETATAVYIGEGTTIQRRCTVNGSTRIGANCIFAPNVFVSSGTHPFRFVAHLPIREQERRLAGSEADLDALDRPVWIQDDCWLGANVVVCPGVTIGKGSVVGANCVVTRDVPPYSVVAGVPAQVIGQRLQWIPGDSIDAGNEADQPYVLSGRLLQGAAGKPAFIEASLDTPLCFALSAASSTTGLSLQWHAQAPVQFEIGGRAFSLAAGSGRLELPIEVLRNVNGILHGAVAVSGEDHCAVLLVHHIALETIG